MHSSRMRTARSLTASRSIGGVGACMAGGVTGGVCMAVGCVAGCAWQGVMCGRGGGACVAGGVYGRGLRGVHGKEAMHGPLP